MSSKFERDLTKLLEKYRMTASLGPYPSNLLAQFVIGSIKEFSNIERERLRWIADIKRQPAENDSGHNT